MFEAPPGLAAREWDLIPGVPPGRLRRYAGSLARPFVHSAVPLAPMPPTHSHPAASERASERACLGAAPARGARQVGAPPDAPALRHLGHFCRRDAVPAHSAPRSARAGRSCRSSASRAFGAGALSGRDHAQGRAPLPWRPRDDSSPYARAAIGRPHPRVCFVAPSRKLAALRRDQYTAVPVSGEVAPRHVCASSLLTSRSGSRKPSTMCDKTL